MTDNILIIVSIIVSAIAVVVSLKTVISTRRRYYREYLHRKGMGDGKD